ncbi:hypothetical protein Y032_0005g2683 [Ancylostoma ceylanicum]|uniref:Uncharacterized protein n=1 Tax=Ancylostoma ceylanicum TaxID=53326 RepID=A0A016VSY6_9BILA|nr:hypothetical protein Y032_0005g2683 [Ancylostoma ceylanicum]
MDNDNSTALVPFLCSFVTLYCGYAYNFVARIIVLCGKCAGVAFKEALELVISRWAQLILRGRRRVVL